MVQRKHYDKYKIEKVIQPYTIHMKDPKDFNDGNNKYFRFIDSLFYFCGGEEPIPAEWLGDNHIEALFNLIRFSHFFFHNVNCV